jgi:hypothetical protein
MNTYMYLYAYIVYTRNTYFRPQCAASAGGSADYMHPSGQPPVTRILGV